MDQILSYVKPELLVVVVFLVSDFLAAVVVSDFAAEVVVTSAFLR